MCLDGGLSHVEHLVHSLAPQCTQVRTSQWLDIIHSLSLLYHSVDGNDSGSAHFLSSLKGVCRFTAPGPAFAIPSHIS